MRLSPNGVPARNSRGYQVQCPGHNDKRASLSIVDGHTNVLLNCFAGCDYETIKQGIQSRGINFGNGKPDPGFKPRSDEPIIKERLWQPNPSIPDYALNDIPQITFRKGRNSPAYQLSRAYPYRTKDGGIACLACRFDYVQDGKKVKDVITYTWATNTKTGETKLYPTHFENNRPLYNLNHIVANPDLPIFLNEGEKAAEAGGELFPNWIPTTPSNGVASYQRADWTPLIGRDVILGPDFDQGGMKFAAVIADYLFTLGVKSLRLLQMPTQFTIKDGTLVRKPYVFSKGDDCHDFKEQGWTHELIKQATIETNHQLTIPLVSNADLQSSLKT